MENIYLDADKVVKKVEKVERLGEGLIREEELEEKEEEEKEEEEEEGRTVLSTVEGKKRLVEFKRVLTASSPDVPDPSSAPTVAQTVITSSAPTGGDAEIGSAQPSYDKHRSVPIIAMTATPSLKPTIRPTAPTAPTVGGTTLTCLVHIAVLLPENSNMLKTKSRIDIDLFKEYSNKNLQLYVNTALAALIASDSFQAVDVNSKKLKITGAIVERITEREKDVSIMNVKTENRPSNRAYLAVFESPVDRYVNIFYLVSYFIFYILYFYIVFYVVFYIVFFFFFFFLYFILYCLLNISDI
jgi:hypothetical protein